MKQTMRMNEMTLPPNEVSRRGRFLVTYQMTLCTPSLFPCKKLLIFVLGLMQNVFKVFNYLSSESVKVGAIKKDAIEARAKAITVTKKNSDVTSKEDLIAIPRRMVAQNAEKSWTVPTLAMQLVTL